MVDEELIPDSAGQRLKCGSKWFDFVIGRVVVI